MRITVYILLAYFSFINLVGVSDVHVHHDGVFNSVSIIDACHDDHAPARDADRREGMSEHLFEHGCIVSSASADLPILQLRIIYECETPTGILYRPISRVVTPLSVKHECLFSRHSVPAKLRAPPFFS